MMVTYTIHYRLLGAGTLAFTPGEWRVRKRGQASGHGAPTAQNIAKHVASLEESFRSGGCNEHVGEVTIAEAWIIDHRLREKIASWAR